MLVCLRHAFVFTCVLEYYLVVFLMCIAVFILYTVHESTNCVSWPTCCIYFHFVALNLYIITYFYPILAFFPRNTRCLGCFRLPFPCDRGTFSGSLQTPYSFHNFAVLSIHAVFEGMTGNRRNLIWFMLYLRLQVF